MFTRFMFTRVLLVVWVLLETAGIDGAPSGPIVTAATIVVAMLLPGAFYLESRRSADFNRGRAGVTLGLMLLMVSLSVWPWGGEGGSPPRWAVVAMGLAFVAICAVQLVEWWQRRHALAESAGGPV